MKMKIFNDTKTIELNDTVVDIYTKVTGVPVDTKCAEYALACDGITETTELAETALAEKVTKSLQMDIEAANDIANGKISLM